MTEQNNEQNEKLAAFLRANAPHVPAPDAGLEDRVMRATIHNSFVARTKSFFGTNKRYFGWISAIAVTAGLAMTFVSFRSSSNIPTAAIEPVITAVATVNQTNPDQELDAFVLETMDGIEPEQALAFNTTLDIF